ncbi:fuconate dehydratase, partial [Leifsonia sp. SIMBA_070]
SQMRWLGPEKGVSHMACGALVNALWDIRARREKKPLWLLLSEMDTDEIISAVDFTHIRNALTPEDAADILRKGHTGRDERIAELKRFG